MIKAMGVASLFLFDATGSAVASDIRPDVDARDFYEWYVSASDAAAADGANQPPFQKSGIEQYITRKLRTEIADAYLKGRYDDLAGGADYFLHAQDTGPDWASAIAARTVRLAGDDAAVQVVLGAHPDSRVSLCVRLRREPDGWRINAVDRRNSPGSPPGCHSD